MGKPENAVQKVLNAYYKVKPMLKMFRNNTGAVSSGGRGISFGLEKGSSDSIGWYTVAITPAMIGKHVAVFAGVETKTRTGRVSPDQRRCGGNIDYRNVSRGCRGGTGGMGSWN